MQDFGVVLPLELHCDSPATRGIAKRRGLGKQRHIDLQSLWIQEKLAQGAFQLSPVFNSSACRERGREDMSPIDEAWNETLS